MSDYFRNVPDFDYVSRLPGAKISDYITLKNFFKRGFIREDIFQELSFFTKYKIRGDDRPDNVAWNFYQESGLDWLVLTCNNILNIQTEWPLKQTDFDRFLLDKYDTYEKLNEIHHYETIEIKNTRGTLLLKEGLQVDADFSMTYIDSCYFVNPYKFLWVSAWWDLPRQSGHLWHNTAKAWQPPAHEAIFIHF